MSQHRALIELSVFQGDTLIARQSFDQDKIILGRISSADFRIPSPQVSRIHALLEILPDGQMKLTDLASTHGTFVNGGRVVEAILRDSDQVKIADATLKIVRVSRPATQSVPRSTATAAAGASAIPVVSSTPEVAPPPVREAPQAPAVSVGENAVQASAQPERQREATVIRSLKKTASERGVLDANSNPHEELEVTVYWEDTILAIDHYKKGNSTITLGDGIKSTYISTETSVPANYKFVELRGNKVEINLHPSMKMSARINGHMYTSEELARSGRTKIEISGNDIAKVKIGNIHFFLMFVPDPPPLPMGPLVEKDPMLWATFVSIFILAFLAMTYALVSQKPIEGIVKEFPESQRKILVATFKMKQEKLAVQPVQKVEDVAKQGTGIEEAKKIPDAIKGIKNELGGNEGEGKRSPGPEGKRGEKNSPHDTGVTVAPRVKGPDSKARGPTSGAGKGGNKQVSKFGLLQSLKNSGLSSRLAKMAGTDGGNDDLPMKFSGFGGGGLQSARGVSPRGGLVGTGSGGGGTEPVVGVGGLGTKGFGQGAKGDGLGGIPGKGAALISTESGGISVGAGISKEEIDRVVKSHMSELNFCLQQALQRRPDLGGKMALTWTIVGGGAVAKVRQVDNTTGDRALVECFMSRLQQWKFPVPPAGAAVEVEYYPFTVK